MLSSLLRSFIREALYRMTPPKRLKLEPIDVDAKNTRDAGEEAAKQVYAKSGARIDPFSFDAQLLPEPASGGGDWEELNIDEVADNIGHQLIDTVQDLFGKAGMMTLRFFIPMSDDSEVWIHDGNTWWNWNGDDITGMTPDKSLHDMLKQPRRERDPATVAFHASKQKTP